MIYEGAGTHTLSHIHGLPTESLSSRQDAGQACVVGWGRLNSKQTPHRARSKFTELPSWIAKDSNKISQFPMWPHHNHSYSQKEGDNCLWNISPLLLINIWTVITQTCVIQEWSHKLKGHPTESIRPMRNCIYCICVILLCEICQRSLCGRGCIIGGSGFIMGPSLWALAYCQ